LPTKKSVRTSDSFRAVRLCPVANAEKISNHQDRFNGQVPRGDWVYLGADSITLTEQHATILRPMPAIIVLYFQAVVTVMKYAPNTAKPLFAASTPP